MTDTPGCDCADTLDAQAREFYALADKARGSRQDRARVPFLVGRAAGLAYASGVLRRRARERRDG